MGAAKWLLGGLGFVMAGPIGAIIGVVIGGLFEGTAALPGADNNTQERQQGGYRRQAASASDVRVSLLVLIACVMKADGRVKKVELDVVKQFLVRNYGEQGALQALQVLKHLLEQEINPEEVSAQIAANINYSTRLELVHFLLELANADGDFADSEKLVIDRIVASLRLSDADYRSLLALYQKAQDPNWAYQALEIEPGATNDEVKKAYRRMAMKYHPDKVAGAGEEIREKATEKFRAINEAYEAIKKQRDMA
ncbi:MAG: TerB family tellurite resistance protein [Bacteroidales bacterium]|nr:TerB family tellurite resistance protein [Candidatus Colicola faecequi]